MDRLIGWWWFGQVVNGLTMCLTRRALGLVTILAAVFLAAVRLVPVRVPNPRGSSNVPVPVGSDELPAIGWSDDFKARLIVAVSAVVDHPTYILEAPPAFFESARHIGKACVTTHVDFDALVVRRMAQDFGQGARGAHQDSRTACARAGGVDCGSSGQRANCRSPCPTARDGLRHPDSTNNCRHWRWHWWLALTLALELVQRCFQPLVTLVTLLFLNSHTLRLELASWALVGCCHWRWRWALPLALGLYVGLRPPCRPRTSNQDDELVKAGLASQAAPSLACRPHDEHDEPHGPAQGVDAIDHGLALSLRCLQPLDANELLVLQSHLAPSQTALSQAMMCHCWALALALAWSWALSLALRRLGLPQGCLQPPLATLARAA